MDERTIEAALQRAAASDRPSLEVVAGDRPRPVARLGLVPGSFDPVTEAHLAVGHALGAGGCDFVLFVYSSRTLPKEGPAVGSAPLLSPGRRIALLERVCRTRPGFGVAISSRGLLVDQAAVAAEAFPGAGVVLGVGSDKLRQVFDGRWYQDRDAALERLFEVAELRYAIRAGDEDAVAAVLSSEPRWASRVRRLRVPEEVAGVSSSAIRDLLRAGEDVTGLVPAEAVSYLG